MLEIGKENAFIRLVKEDGSHLFENFRHFCSFDRYSDYTIIIEYYFSKLNFY